MPNAPRNLQILRAMLIVAAGFWIFSPAFQGTWLMDDDFYLPSNALRSDPARLWKIWFAPGSLIEYYPIEASLQAVQWHLWHNQTLGYHLTNLLLHLCGAFLVWRLLAKFGLRLAWLGGLIFTVHPVVVESVAWIAEFKNVLSLPPLLLALCAWIDYDAHGRRRDYCRTLAFFFIAMLCKISMALFPLVILLYAWWKRSRIDRRDLVHAGPFFLISLVLGSLTILAGEWFRQAHQQAPVLPEMDGLLSRIALAGLSISFYFVQCICPVNLIPLYPKWVVNPPSLLQFLPWPILGAVLYGLWTRRATWGRHALLGLGFFLINIAPFVGLTAATYMVFSWVMDHFLYLPMIGLIGLLVAALGHLDQQLTLTKRPLLTGLLAVAIGSMAWESHAYAGRFINQEELWTYTVQRNPGAFLAHNNLGNVFFQTGRVAQAIEQYQLALALHPQMVEAHTNLGLALDYTGRKAEAVAQLEAALQINPNFVRAQVNLANTLTALSRIPEARQHYERALQIEPGNAEARDALTKLNAASTTVPPHS